MNIYTPYTYLIGWSKHNTFYYGRRTAQNCHPNEFWAKYFTSSSEVKEFRIENGDPDIIQIRKTFPNNPDACKLWECKVLERIDAQHDSRFLNKRNGDHKWDVTGKVSVKDKNGKTLQVSKDDPRYLSGELISAATGKVTVKDKNGKTIQVSKDDTRYLSGELIGVVAGKVSVKDEEGNTFQVSKDDSRYLSGELVHVLVGKSNTPGYTNEYREQNGFKTIPGKPLGSKEKEETKQKKSNSRKGKTTVRDKEGNCFLVDVNDPKFISGEYISVMTGVGIGRKFTEKQKQNMRKPRTQEQKQNIKEATLLRPIFYCECCDKSIKGVPQWNSHLSSIKHRNKMGD